MIIIYTSKVADLSTGTYTVLLFICLILAFIVLLFVFLLYKRQWLFVDVGI